MDVNEILKIADIESLQNLVGKNVLDSILAIDQTLGSPAKLRQLVLQLYHPSQLLLDKNKRNVLIDLLPLEMAKKLGLILGCSQEISYEYLKKLKIKKNTSHSHALLNFFSVNELPIKEKEDLPFYSDITSKYSLFPHQRVAVRDVEALFETDKRRCILHMPTGSGKTRTSMNIVCNHLRKNEPSIVIWLANSEELCEQAAEEFEKAWSFLGDRELSVYRLWGNKKLDPDEIKDGFFVIGLAKLYSLLKKSISLLSAISSKANLVIIDEAHIAVAETYHLILDALVLTKIPNPPLLGLTATPGRTWDEVDVDKELSNLFYRQKIKLNIPGYENPVQYLVDQEYIANVKYTNLYQNNQLTFTDRDYDDISENMDIPIRILRLLADDQIRNVKIINTLENLSYRHKRIIFFATTVEHSEVISSILTLRGFNTVSVTGKTEKSKRNKLIKSFRDDSDDIKIICNYGVLTTGFDAPRTSAALIARPTKSLVLYSQMVGRAIRGIKAGGNKEAEIITVIDRNLPGFDSVASAFTNWEDIWE